MKYEIKLNEENFEFRLTRFLVYFPKIYAINSICVYFSFVYGWASEYDKRLLLAYEEVRIFI